MDLNKQNGFTLIELLVVVAIIGILAAVGVVAYSGYTSVARDNALKMNCRQYAEEIGAIFAFCQFNPGSTIPLKSIGGRQTIENVPCDKNKTDTHKMLSILANHFDNEGLYKNPYGHNSGDHGIMGGQPACQASSGLCWQDLMIKGNKYNYLSLGRCVPQYDKEGNIGVTGFFDKGTYKSNGRDVSEALQVTNRFMTADMR